MPKNSSMATVRRYGLTMRNTSVSGSTAKRKEREPSTTQTAMCSKENLNKTKQMDLEHTNTKAAKLTREAGLMTYKKAKVRRFYRMEAYTRANSTLA